MEKMKTTTILSMAVLLSILVSACGNTTAPDDVPDELSAGSDEIVGESGDAETMELPENRADSMSAQYEIGDIVLADGSIVKEGGLIAIDSNNLPIAVIAGFEEDGTALGVGVHRSDMPLQWASDDSAGYMTNFADIACTQESEFGFAGDRDGRNNWEIICEQAPEDGADAEANYPAFHFVNTYAETYHLPEGYDEGWYMPSIAELCVIYQNRAAFNDSLQHIYELDDQAAMNGLETNWYWSSSQAGSEDDYAWFVHYFNGYAGECPKNFTNVHALAVRTF